MVLTEHQLFHLRAVKEEAEYNLKLESSEKNVLLSAKNITLTSGDSYYEEIIKDVEEIIKSEKFPDLHKDCMIHDYIEKDTKESFKNG